MPIDASSLRIVSYPDKVLRARAKAIAAPPVSDEVRNVARVMIELMFEAEGIGLAAPQVGLDWRLFVVHVPESETRSAAAGPGDPLPEATPRPTVYINPVLSLPEGAPELMEEGCLSLPEIRGDLLRPPTITITALDLEGQPFSQRATGLLARCWQHELDHLDGVLIIDRFTNMSRIKNKRAIRDLELT
jgi:peptide deformylase